MPRVTSAGLIAQLRALQRKPHEKQERCKMWRSKAIQYSAAAAIAYRAPQSTTRTREIHVIHA